ncbi:MAG TPA: hypothetical protein VF532_18155 [Candidatus Angelobacter sp.]
MQILLRGLLVAAYLLLGMAAFVLCMGLIGVSLPRRVPMFLILPVFPIFGAAVFVGRQLTSGFTEREVRKSHWKILLRGCPPWAIKVVTVLGWMTMASFAILVFAPASRRDELAMRIVFPVYGTGFASYSLAVFYSALHLGNERRVCSKGHDVSPMQKYCPECGELLNPGSDQVENS